MKATYDKGDVSLTLSFDDLLLLRYLLGKQDERLTFDLIMSEDRAAQPGNLQEAWKNQVEEVKRYLKFLQDIEKTIAEMEVK